MNAFNMMDQTPLPFLDSDPQISLKGLTPFLKRPSLPCQARQKMPGGSNISFGEENQENNSALREEEAWNFSFIMIRSLTRKLTAGDVLAIHFQRVMFIQ